MWGLFSSRTAVIATATVVFLVSCVTGPLHKGSPGCVVRSWVEPSPIVCIAVPPVM